MKKHLLSAVLVFLAAETINAQDLAGAKDPSLFPNRMSNYFLTDQVKNFDAVEFNLAAGGSKNETKEGNKTMTRYDFNGESGQQKPSGLQILKNYENAVKNIGGTTIFQSAGEAMATYKISKPGKEIWVKLESGGDNNNDFYVVTILEIEAMTQEVTASDILSALNADGHIALYINFETGKSDIKPESQKIIDEVAKMLTSNPALKISVEGHTDNSGTPAGNKTLSENRAKSVVAALIAKGIDKARLSSKGWGQEKPLTGNDSEDGKAKNRRVEIIKA
ncbi:MAG: OmpA family protein [Bacteroidia bacterium]